MENRKIIFKCKKCNYRLFDYLAGDISAEIEMKCSRCRRTFVLKKYSEAMIRQYADRDMFRI